MDEGSRSNAQYRGAEGNLGPDAWGTEAQGTHDKAARRREGNARYDVCAKERQEGP